jgi:Ni,Fe-hydrogenase maturation factor
MLASLHGFDMSRVLFMAGNERRPEVTVFGIEPARIEWGTELSPTVQRVLPAVEQAIESELTKRDSVPNSHSSEVALEPISGRGDCCGRDSSNAG